MKSNLNNLVASVNKAFLKKAILTVGVSFAMLANADAQCLVSSYDISTALDNSTGSPVLLSGVAPDPKWKVSDRTIAFGTTTGFPIVATVVNYSGYSLTAPWAGAGWISDAQNHVNPGVIADQNDYVTFRRDIQICGTGNVDFNLQFLSDNYVNGVYIDGVLQTGTIQTPGSTTYNTWWPVVFTITGMTSGMHTIEVKIQETNTSPLGGVNPVGFAMIGSISSASSIIVNDWDPECENFDCTDTGCNNTCYWRVEGNTILNGNNIFGTISDDDIDIKSNNMSRGVIKGGNSTHGGFFGWNTTTPTARFHVNCNNGNDGIPSDIRFEDLESGEGSILVIDKDGYVYNSHVPAAPEPPLAPEVMNMKEEIRELKTQLAELRQSLAAGGVDKYNAQVQNELYQNNPNPFGKETSIGYNIANMQQGAFIAVYDLNGKEIFRQAVTEKGKGSVTLSGEKLVPGMYLYSLIVDGKETATKRMVVTK